MVSTNVDWEPGGRGDDAAALERNLGIEEAGPQWLPQSSSWQKATQIVELAYVLAGLPIDTQGQPATMEVTSLRCVLCCYLLSSEVQLKCDVHSPAFLCHQRFS